MGLALCLECLYVAAERLSLHFIITGFGDRDWHLRSHHYPFLQTFLVHSVRRMSSQHPLHLCSHGISLLCQQQEDFRRRLKHFLSYMKLANSRCFRKRCQNLIKQLWSVIFKTVANLPALGRESSFIICYVFISLIFPDILHKLTTHILLLM